MKKVLIINPNAGKSGLISTIGDNECVGFYKILTEAGYNAQYLKPNKLDEEINTITLEEIEDINIYDIIFLYNYNINFFGGAENPFLINCITTVSKFKGKVYYLLVDMNIFLKQMGTSILKRQWDSVKQLTVDDITIGDVHYLSQGYNLALIDKLKQQKNIVSTKTSYYPLQTSSIFNKDTTFGEYKEDREYDLYYGGSFRSGRRETQFREYFFNKDRIDTAFFGSIKEGNFENNLEGAPVFNGRVKQEEIIEENSRGLATIILSEKHYNDNVLTLRIYECLLADMVVFIDNKYDTKKKIFNDPELKQFNYVKNGKELEEKILKLKNDKNFLYNIINKQRKEFNERLFVRENLVSLLKKIIEEN